MIKKEEFFTTYHQLCKSFGTTLRKDALLNLILQSAMNTMDAKAAGLFLIDTRKNKFNLAAHTERFPDYFDVNSSQVEKLLDELFPDGYLNIRNATKDPRLVIHSVKKGQCIVSSILIVLVMVNNKALGVLSLYSVESVDYSEDQIDFLIALSDLSGIALMHVNLIERIMKKYYAFGQPYLQNSIVSSLKLEINGIGRKRQ